MFILCSVLSSLTVHATGSMTRSQRCCLDRLVVALREERRDETGDSFRLSEMHMMIARYMHNVCELRMPVLEQIDALLQPNIRVCLLQPIFGTVHSTM
jgi:hypothetical protein